MGYIYRNFRVVDTGLCIGNSAGIIPRMLNHKLKILFEAFDMKPLIYQNQYESNRIHTHTHSLIAKYIFSSGFSLHFIMELA